MKCGAGHAEFLDDAKRLVLARILPSPILQTPPLRPMTDDGKDPRRDLERRIIGGYGGCHSHSHGGKRAVTDVTSADVHILVDIYNHVVLSHAGRLEIIFHLQCEDSRVRIVSRRQKDAELKVTPKSDTAVAIRVPRWTPRESVRIQVGGVAHEPTFAGAFAWIGKVPAGPKIAMGYDLPERSTKERGLGAEYEILWRGDDVIGVRPNAEVKWSVGDDGVRGKRGPLDGRGGLPEQDPASIEIDRERLPPVTSTAAAASAGSTAD